MASGGKAKKMRGNHTHGRGKKAGRGAGLAGGRGRAGANKHRYLMLQLLGGKHAHMAAKPWGRIGSGVVELIAVVLLLIPKTVPLGALLSLGVISGAIVSHITKLGFVVRNDGGLLFALAVTVFICSALVLVLRRRELVNLLLTPLHSGECQCSVHR